MKAAVDVHNFLVERDIPHELVPMKGRVRSPERAAGILGLPPEQVGKVILFEGEGRLVAALVAADRDPDPGRVAAAAGSDPLGRVAPERATDLTEFLHEALPPVGLPADAVVVDEDLSRQEVVYFPGGEATSLLKIRGPDLVAVTGAVVAPIAGGPSG